MSTAICGLGLVLATSACKAKGSRIQEPTTESATVPAEKDVKARVRKHLVESLQADPSQVRVEVYGDLDVPGMAVFSALASLDEHPFDARTYGVLTSDGELITNKREAMQRVIGAWSYDASRRVDAATVATAIGVFMGGKVDEATTVLERNIDQTPDRWKKKVFVPTETQDQGMPAIEFWVLAGDPPLSRVIASFPGDGTVNIRIAESVY